MNEYVGLDVSKEETSICVKDVDGVVLYRGESASTPESIFSVLKRHSVCPVRIVLETGTLSGYLARGLRRLGLPADVIDARQAHAVMKLQINKSDAKDADLLADIARTGLCKPVAVKSELAQEAQIVLKTRRHLVKTRRNTENTVRGLLGSLGYRFPKGSARLVELVRQALGDRPDLSALIEPLLRLIEAVAAESKDMDKEAERWAGNDAACALLMTVPSVGPNTALAFVSAIGDPQRFKSSRTVGAYIGLTTRRYQSGEMDYSGRISKMGDKMLRSLLYNVANNMLTVSKKQHPLKDWGRRVAKRRGHQKACVALARKLAVILHKMLITGDAYRWGEAKEARKENQEKMLNEEGAMA